MRQAVWMGLFSLLLAVLVPALLLQPIQEPEPETVALVISPAESKPEPQEVVIVRLKSGQSILELPLEEYLTGVVLSDIFSLGLFEKATKMKYDIPNSRLELFDGLISEINEKIGALNAGV